MTYRSDSAFAHGLPYQCIRLRDLKTPADLRLAIRYIERSEANYVKFDEYHWATVRSKMLKAAQLKIQTIDRKMRRLQAAAK